MMMLERDQADREARFARNCKFTVRFALPVLTLFAKPTHGLQLLWQVSFCHFITAGEVHNVC